MLEEGYSDRPRRGAAMGEIVPISSTSGALIAQDPQKELELREQRIQEVHISDTMLNALPSRT